MAEDEEQTAYRLYVTESLRLRGENRYIQQSWLDMVNPVPADIRTGDEIAIDFVTRAGLRYKGGE